MPIISWGGWVLNRILFIFTIGLLALFPSQVIAAIINVPFCTSAAVQSAHDDSGTHDGDTLVLPAGTCTWTNIVVITKAVTITGSGTPTVDANGNANGNSTIIRDGLTGGSSSYNPLFAMAAVAGKSSRLSNIEFDDGGRTPQDSWGVVYLLGTGNPTDGSAILVDYCFFNGLNGPNINFYDFVGVVTHSWIRGKTGVLTYNIRVFDPAWNGGSYGDGSYAAASNFGSAQFLFIEHNTITQDVGFNYTCFDGLYAARVTARFNHTRGCSFSFHGSESGQRNRSSRAFEIYCNIMDGDGFSTVLADIRGGTGMIFSNTGTNYTASPFVGNLVADRMIANFTPWNGANGANPWDVNSGSNPFTTGTTSSGGTLTVTVSGTPWMPNQWVGYTVLKTSGCVTDPCFSVITSNTSSQLTYLDPEGHGTDLAFSAGNTFSINKVTWLFDQPGRTMGSLVSGDPPSPPTGWNNQTTEPLYDWLNVIDGGQTTLSAHPNCPQCAQNVIHYDYTASFNGTAGVGSGPRASRPASTTNGVGWFSTDAGGNWNTVGGGSNDGCLDIVQSGAWIDCVYTPYTYPHPLASSSITLGVSGSFHVLRGR